MLCEGLTSRFNGSIYKLQGRLICEQSECAPIDREQVRIVLEKHHDVEVEQRRTQEERVESIQHAAVSANRVSARWLSRTVRENLPREVRAAVLALADSFDEWLEQIADHTQHANA